MTIYRDYPIEEILTTMEEIAANGGKVYLKWTCPVCGERCVANEPNAYCTEGYTHEEKTDGSPCGGVYTGTMFNTFVMLPLPRSEES